MVRHYKMKGQKRKKSVEKYDKDVEEETTVSPCSEDEVEEVKKAKAEIITENGNSIADGKESATEVPSIPIVLTENVKAANKPGVVFILEKASLEVAKVGKNYQLLNSDKHAGFLKRNGRNPADYRPDIAHQCIVCSNIGVAEWKNEVRINIEDVVHLD